MSKSIQWLNGIITLTKTDCECPECKTIYDEDFYYNQLCKSKKGFIYKTCKKCKSKIGLSFNMMGDTVSWLKKDEEKLPILK